MTLLNQSKGCLCKVSALSLTACSLSSQWRVAVVVQGRSPLPYAVSELIDNALRATQHNTEGRQIVITLALSGGSSPHTGLISVWDNGE